MRIVKESKPNRCECGKIPVTIIFEDIKDNYPEQSIVLCKCGKKSYYRKGWSNAESSWNSGDRNDK
jgi:hypothetical protein